LKRNTKYLLGAAMMSSVVLLAGCGGKSNDAVAVVNGEPITFKDYVAHMELKPEVRVVTQNGPAVLPVEGTIGFQALRDLISQQLTIQLAKDKGIYPTNQQIEQEIEFQKKLNKNFLVQLSSRGMTVDMIRRSLAIDLINEQLLTKGITVTKADVEEYIKKNPDEFMEPERVELYWVLVRNSKMKEAVDRDLASGVGFSQVALRYSDAPNAREANGRLVDERTGQAPRMDALPGPVQELIKRMKPGDISDWVRFLDAHAKFFVERKIPARQVTMDDTKKEFLRRLLAKKKGSEGRDVNKEILDKLNNSKVTIVKSQFKKPWEQALEQFKKESSLESLTGTTNAD
jgi:parvulin-like peptidyl-prolyl isomerase